MEAQVKRNKKAEKIFKEIKAENLPDLMKNILLRDREISVNPR